MRKLILIVALAVLAFASTACGGNDKGKTTPVIVNPDKKDDPDTPTPPTPPTSDTKPEIGKVIPPWVKGNLDIHFINTSNGECTFIILPDGTQILVDAAGSEQSTGAVGSQTNTGIRKRWDPSRDPNFDCGEFIIDYIEKCMAWTGNKKLDYVLLTHFHGDHYGVLTNRPVSSLSRAYRLQSLVQILERFEVGKLLDRGYPDYSYPFDLLKANGDGSAVANWITAVKWLVANKGLKAEKFEAGSNTQISMVYSPTSYNCTVQNLAVNGDVWTGTGTGYISTFPSISQIVCAKPPSVGNGDACPEENHVSCCFKLSYGNFDYFAGGDIQYDGCSSFAWKDIETPVAKASGKVEVMKADHHGSSTTNGVGYKGKLGTVSNAMEYTNPQCWVVCGYTDGHPRQATYEGVIDLLPQLDAYILNSCSEMRAYKDYSKRTKGDDGHVLVRVENGGMKYTVYVLTDSDRKMTVKTIGGSYTSR